MRKQFSYLIFLFTYCLMISAFAQNPDLPKDEVIIYLNNGKQIKGVRLWEIYPGRIEYEQKGNLHDLPVEEISGILYPDGKIYILQEGKMVTQNQLKPPVTTSVPSETPEQSVPLNGVFSEVNLVVNETKAVKETPVETKTSTLTQTFSEKPPAQETKVIKENPGDCYTSFIRGKQAAARPGDIDNLQYFCAGCIPLYPLNILYATTTYDPASVPAGTDARCYREGYLAGRRKKQIENLAIGGVTFWALVLAAIIVL